MKIILQEEVEKLGHRGEVVDVADGFARNFLLPRNLAIPASDGNLRRLEQIRKHLAKRTAAEKGTAQQIAEVLAQTSVTISRKAGETDQLFGSVTAADVAGALAAQGLDVDKRRIHIEEPIKLLGEYAVPVRLVHGVESSVKVIVTRE